jgi:hypothetical protein
MKGGLYFVLYVAVVLEILIVIVDRDEAEDQLKQEEARLVQERDSIAVGLAEIYSRDLVLSSPSEVTVPFVGLVSGQGHHLAPEVSLVFACSGLWTREEIKDLRYSVHSEQTNASAGPVIVDPIVGTGRCSVTFTRPGEYTITATCQTVRAIPSFLPERVRRQIENRLRVVFGTPMVVRSNTELIMVRVTEVRIPCK